MKLIFTIVFIMCFGLTQGNGQSIELIEDFVEGPSVSAFGPLFIHGNSIVYNGKTPMGENAVLRYDCDSSEIFIATKKDEIGWGKTRLTSVDDRLFIIEKEDEYNNVLYEATRSDLSDLRVVYDAGSSMLVRIQSYGDQLLVFEMDTLAHTNILLIDERGKVHAILKDLFDVIYAYSNVRFNGHYIIAHSEGNLEEYGVIAIDTLTKAIVDAKQLIPAFQNHNRITRVETRNERSFMFDADSTYIYNINYEKTYALTKEKWEMLTENEKFIFVHNKKRIIKINKATGEKSQILADVNHFNKISDYIVGVNSDSSYLRLIVHNFNQNETTYYNTDIISDKTFNISDIAIVPRGMHVSVRYSKSPQAKLYRISEDEIELIDTLHAINRGKRIIAYQEDIFIAYKHEEYGTELFRIDYPKPVGSKIDAGELSVHPNPASEYITIKTKRANDIKEISILDATGQAILQNCKSTAQDVSHLASGVYTILVTFKGEVSKTVQFIKL
ncbi:MAG: T9SS type A sorting domain-containing protein [Bacteroidota bacterium]